MLSDLDHRQSVAANSNASNDSADPYLSIPSGLTSNRKKIPYAKIGLSFFIIFLLTVTGYYSYLIYKIQTEADVKVSKTINNKSSIISQPKKIAATPAVKKNPTIIAAVKQPPKTKAPIISTTVKENNSAPISKPISDISINTNQSLQSDTIETENAIDSDSDSD